MTQSNSHEIWSYRNERAKTFSIANKDESISEGGGRDAALIAARTMGNRSHVAFIDSDLSLRTREEIDARRGNNDRCETGQELHHHRRVVITPLAEDVSPPRSSLRTLTRPIPESAADALQMLRALRKVPTSTPTPPQHMQGGGLALRTNTVDDGGEGSRRFLIAGGSREGPDNDDHNDNNDDSLFRGHY